MPLTDTLWPWAFGAVCLLLVLRCAARQRHPVLAVLAGADYVAVYCGRIDRAGGSSQAVLHEIADFIQRGGFRTHCGTLCQDPACSAADRKEAHSGQWAGFAAIPAFLAVAAVGYGGLLGGQPRVWVYPIWRFQNAFLPCEGRDCWCFIGTSANACG